MDKHNNESFTQNTISQEDTDSETSFVKKVKSRVSGLIPSSLTKWFGSSEKATTRTREELDEDDEDISLQIQPPSKRVKRLSNQEEHNTIYQNNTLRDVRGIGLYEPQPGPSGLNIRNTFIHTQRSNIYTQNEKESDEESTSGCSSLARFSSRERHVPETLQPSQISSEVSSRNRDMPSTSNRTLNLRKDGNTSLGFSERSLFLDTSLNSSANTSLSSRRPTFNASFGSPNFVDKTLSTKRIINSPFYKGRTIYGGASAYTGRRLTDSVESKNLIKASVQVKPSNEPTPNGNTTLSKTARRILDTLEQYTTPLADAKKIPNPLVRNKQDGLISKYTRAHPYRSSDSKKPSNKELYVPTVPDLLKMKLKERIQDSTVNVRHIASTSKSVLNSPGYFIPPQKDTETRSSKIKSKITSTRESKSRTISEEPAKPVDLPNVALPITTLPKFDFVLPPTTSAVPSKADTSKEKTNASNTKTFIFKKPESTNVSIFGNKGSLQTESSKPIITAPVITSTPIVSQKKEVTNTQYQEYEFSKPLVISENLKSIKAINNFIFSDPVSKKVEKNDSTKQINFTYKTPDKLEPLKKTLKVNGENFESNVKNAHNSFLSSTNNLKSKSPNITVTDSVGKTSDFGAQFKMSSDKWECSACLVRNKVNDTKCVACTTPKPAAKAQNTSSSQQVSCIPTVSSFGNQFKQPENTWKCNTCMIVNKEELSKCAACETPKESSMKAAERPPLSNLFKPPADTWECSVCMIRNNADKIKCAACETPKAIPKNTNCTQAKLLDQGIKTTSGFGSQFKPAENTWECGTCMIRNQNEASKCVACETPKPGAKPTLPSVSNSFGSQFKKKETEWECSSCMVRNGVDKLKCQCCEAPKPASSPKTNMPASKPTISSTLSLGIGGTISAQGFTFGIKPESNKPAVSNASLQPSAIFGESAKVPTSAPATFSFGVKPTAAENKSEPSKSEAPSIQFGSTPINSKVPNVESAKTSESVIKSSKPVNGGFTLASSSSGSKTESGPVFGFGIKPSTTPASTSSTMIEPTKPTEIAKVTETAKPVFSSPASAPMFKFGSSDSMNKPPSFGSTNTATTANTFGSTAAAIVATTSPTFGTATSITFGSTSSTFGSTTSSTFGNTATTSVSTPAPKFGVSSTPTFGSTPAPAFGSTPTPSFGSPATNNTQKNNLFGFGATTNGNKDEPSPKVAKTFSFAQSSQPAETNKTQPFGFGQTNTQANPAAPAFNFTPGNNTQQNSGFGFGSSSTNINPAPFGAPSQPTQNGGFNFGSNVTNSTPKTGFNFGSNQFGSAPATAAPLFNFGANTPSTQAAPTITPGVFSFGPAQTTPNFNFTPGNQPPTFSATPAAENKPVRIIKKALRRTQR